MPQTILDQIIADKKIEVEDTKKRKPLSTLKVLAEEHQEAKDFGCALLSYSDSPIRIIAECKKKSPSKGVIVDDYLPRQIARSYEAGGAAAVSVLTDEKYFGGRLADLVAVREAVSIPIIRKDFIIDEYQIYEARAAGADSFLLLSSVLSSVMIQYFIEVGRDLGMEPLVETHTEEDLDRALRTDAKIIGINNRNLETFDVDLRKSRSLYSKASKQGKGRILVCESAIKGREDIKVMSKVGFRVYLVGEALMRSNNHTDAVMDLASYRP